MHLVSVPAAGGLGKVFCWTVPIRNGERAYVKET